MSGHNLQISDGFLMHGTWWDNNNVSRVFFSSIDDGRSYVRDSLNLMNSGQTQGLKDPSHTHGAPTYIYIQLFKSQSE